MLAVAKATEAAAAQATTAQPAAAAELEELAELEVAKVKRIKNKARLQSLCLERELDTGGTCAELQARLIEWISDEELPEVELELEKTAKRAKTMAAKFQVGASVKFRNVIYEIKQTLHGDQPIVYGLGSAGLAGTLCYAPEHEIVANQAPPAGAAAPQLLGQLGLNGCPGQHVLQGMQAVNDPAHPQGLVGGGQQFQGGAVAGGQGPFHPPVLPPPLGGGGTDYTGQWMATLGITAEQAHAANLHLQPPPAPAAGSTPILAGAILPNRVLPAGSVLLNRSFVPKDDMDDEDVDEVTVQTSVGLRVLGTKNAGRSPPIKTWAEFHAGCTRRDIYKSQNHLWRDATEQARSHAFCLTVIAFGAKYTLAACMKYDELCTKAVHDRAPGMADWAGYDGQLWSNLILSHH
jgi:hypothetical protein